MVDDRQKEAMTRRRLTRWFAAVLLPAIFATVAAALALAARNDPSPRSVVAVAPSAGEPVRAQEATVNQLDAAALMPDDLEPGFYIVDQSRTSKPPAVLRFLVRLSPDPRLGPDAEQIYLVLAADPSADPGTVASDGVTALQTDSNLTDVTASDPVAAEWLAPGAVVYHFAGRGGVRSVVGTLYAWRQGPVIVRLTVITNTGDSEQATSLAARRPASARQARRRLSRTSPISAGAHPIPRRQCCRWPATAGARPSLWTRSVLVTPST